MGKKSTKVNPKEIDVIEAEVISHEVIEVDPTKELKQSLVIIQELLNKRPSQQKRRQLLRTLTELQKEIKNL